MLLLLVTALLFVLVPDPAHAGPVVAFVGWVGNVIAAGGIGAALMQMAISAALSLVATAIRMSGVKKHEVKVKLEKEFGDDTPLSFCVGQYATPGKLKYVGTWDTTNRYVSEVFEISSFPLTGIGRVWANDEEADIDWSAPKYTSAGNLMGYPVRNFRKDYKRVRRNDSGGIELGTESEDNMWVKFVSGTQTTADPLLLQVFDSDPDYPWTANHIGRGKAYVIATYRYHQDMMTSIPPLLFEPHPLPMYDPRKDSTVGGSGSHRWGQRATYEPTTNGAVIAYNVARGIYWGGEWLFGGKNLPAWRLPIAEWVAAMNACDMPVTLAGGGTEPAYRAGAEISVDMVPLDILEEIGRACNMQYAEVGGMLKPIVGLPGASVLSITDESIVITEGQTYDPFETYNNTFNAITATYPEPREKWASKDAPQYVHTQATADDGGRYLPVSVSYGAAPYARQVQRLLRSQMRDYRRFRRHEFYLPPEAYGLEPMVDMISWTSARNGYTNKKFIVESVSKTPGMLVLVRVREKDPSDYDWSPSFEMPVVIVPPVQPIRWTQFITGFAAVPVAIQDNGGRNRRPAIRVSCLSGQEGVTDIQIRVRLPGQDPFLNVKRPYDEPFFWFIDGVLPGTTYEVEGRLLSERTERSEWSSKITVTTLNIGIGTPDIATEVWDTINDALLDVEEEAKSFGIDPVTTLPATGKRDGQIVLKMPEMILYRWDAASGTWSTSIYAGIPNGAVDVAKFAAGIEPVRIWTGGSLPVLKLSEVLFWNGKIYRWNGAGYVASVAAVDIVGTLTASQIADSAIGVAKFAAGIEPVGISTAGSLPTTKTTNALYWNGKLYRWSGSAYVASVPAADIAGQLASAQIAAIEASKVTGQMTNAQIADLSAAKLTGTIVETQIRTGAISTPKLAAGAVETTKLAAGAVVADKIGANAVTAVKIQAGAVEAAKLAAGAVETDKLAANAVTAGKIAANAVTTDKLDANAVTAGKIAAGAVSTDQLAANSIVASKLAIGAFDNLVPDPGFEEAFAGGPTWLTSGGGGPINIVLARLTADTVTWGGAYVLQLGVSGSGGTNYSGVQSRPFAVTGDTEYYLGALLLTQGTGGGDVIFRIAWYDSTGAVVSYSKVHSGTGNLSVSDGRRSGNVRAPTTAATARVQLYIRNDSVASYVQMGGLAVRKAASGELLVDGVVTTVKLAAGAVETDKLAANAVTAGKISANAVTTDKLDANAVTAGKIAAGAVSADQIAANAISVKHLAIGDFTNFAVGSDFEDDALVPWNISGIANINTSVSQAKTGVKSLAITPGVAFAPLRSAFEVQPGDRITTRFWALRGGSWVGGTSRIRLLDAATNGGLWNILFTEAQIPTAGVWTMLEGTYTVPAGVFRIRPQIVTDGTAGVVYLDDIEIRKQVRGTLIEDGAVTSEKVSAGAVTTDKLAASSVIASKVVAGLITAGSAIIANGAIGNAMIGSAAVGTLEIQGQAVTVPAYSYTAGQVNLVDFNMEVVLQNLGIVRRAGFPTMVMMNVQLTGPEYCEAVFQVYRDGALVHAIGNGTGRDGAATSVMTSFIDQDTSGGSTNYQLRGYRKQPGIGSGGVCWVSKRFMSAHQFQR